MLIREVMDAPSVRFHANNMGRVALQDERPGEIRQFA